VGVKYQDWPGVGCLASCSRLARALVDTRSLHEINAVRACGDPRVEPKDDES